MFQWAKRYPTNTADVARVCHDVALKYLDWPKQGAKPPRILHFSSEDQFTKYEICELFAKASKLSMNRVQPDTPSKEPTAGVVQRPYDTHLSTKALKDLRVDVGTQDFGHFLYAGMTYPRYWRKLKLTPAQAT